MKSSHSFPPPSLITAPIAPTYSGYFNALISCFNNSDYPYEKAISYDWRELYKIDEIDANLIKKWDLRVSSDKFIAAQMISARVAEKLAMKFYEALGYRVEDISAHQITQKSL